MYSYAIVPIIALFCYVFLLLSFLPAKKNGVIYAFMELLVLMVAWTGGSLFMRLEYWPSAGFWFQISLIGLMLIPTAFFHFLRMFMGESRRYRVPLWTALIVAAWLFNWRTGLLVCAPTRVESGAGTGYIYDISWKILILFVLMIGTLCESVRMFCDNRKKNGYLWDRLGPVWVGIGFLVAGNICLLLPVFKAFPIDICAGIPMAVCLYYALYKKRIFQLDLLVSKANCYVVAFFLTMLVFSRLIPGWEAALTERFGLDGAQVAMLISFLMLSASWLFYILLKIFLDVLFVKEDAKYSKGIENFSSRVSQLMGENEILSAVVETIRETAAVDGIFIYLAGEDGNYRLVPVSAQGKDMRAVISGSDHMLGVLREAGGRLLMRDYKATASYRRLSPGKRQLLTKNKIECVAAIRDENRYLGLILLGTKRTGAKYRTEDLDFLSSICSVVSIAIKNSRLYEATYQEARRDYLTGVANRKYFYETLQQCCEVGDYEFGCLVMVSVDDFRLYNQLYGAEAGDDALKRIAGIICEEVPQGGFVARYGGKEFAVLLPGHSVEQAQNVAGRLSERIKAMNDSSGEYAMKVLTVSCGIALGVCPMTDFHELVNHAETAMYYAKQAGKNRTVVYTEGEKQAGKTVAKVRYQTGVYSDYAATVYALTAAIDAKDHYTFSHSENVAYYARELARAYGLNEEGVQIVYEAGLLHDIGKIGIDEGILNKPGKLTKEEYEVIKGHVEMSIGIIRHLPSLDYVIPAVLGHHERYDGNGYPRGLKGEEIPLMARILCVADSFDAMVSERTYKEKMDVGKAVQILRDQAGKQFDPKLVPVFIRIVEDGTLELR